MGLPDAHPALVRRKLRNVTLYRSRSFYAKSALALLLLLTIIAIGAASPATVAASPSQDELRSDIGEVFLLLTSAEARGANVTAAAISLNHALELVNAGGAADLTQAASIIHQVNSSIPSLVAEGEAALYWGTTGLATTLVVLGIAGVLVYFFMPRLVWRLWMRTKKDWRVSAQ